MKEMSPRYISTKKSSKYELINLFPKGGTLGLEVVVFRGDDDGRYVVK